jgi:hypothetical protein
LRGREPLGVRGLAVVLPNVALVTISVTLLVAAVSGSASFQNDFKGDLYLAGDRILHGVSPYQSASLSAEAAEVRAGGSVQMVESPRYPAPILLAAAPMSLIPREVAGVLFMLLSVGAVLAGLRLLGVTDRRCLLVACLSWPVVFGVWLGNVSPLLFLGAASAWRWRARAFPAAGAIAAVVVAKVFVWPLAVWLLIARRVRAFVLAAGIAVVATACAWAVIGFDGLTDYPRLLLNVAAIGEGRGCSLVAALISVGMSPGAARAAALLGGIVLLAVAWRLSRLPDGDRRAFAMVVMVSLIASPIAWAHYLVLLFIPIALLETEFSSVWFVPMLAGLGPWPVPHPDIRASLPAVAAELILITWLCLPLLESPYRRAATLVASSRRRALKRPNVGLAQD